MQQLIINRAHLRGVKRIWYYRCFWQCQRERLLAHAWSGNTEMDTDTYRTPIRSFDC